MTEMNRGKQRGFLRVSRSLKDILGSSYIDAVVGARASVAGIPRQTLSRIAEEKVDFLSEADQESARRLVAQVGHTVCEPLTDSVRGAGTRSFDANTHLERAPLCGCGAFRIGEDGRVYLAAKSEHYHASLGHDFAGHRLIESAKKLGIPNITHNNTRGYITRLLEEELVGAANGVSRDETQAFQGVLGSESPRVLNRVCNLQTGSLAAEAAMKMMLARFYRHEEDLAGDLKAGEPPYRGRTPVFLVIGDQGGGTTANYHGTTVLAQLMRGLWPGLVATLENRGVLVFRAVPPNDLAAFRSVLKEYERPPYKVAGFLHEIILMNYGALRLHGEYLADVHSECRANDVPVLVDEIQSCSWSPELFLFREYGLAPDLVCIGKGMPGGQYPDSRLIATPALDNLSQFGALVTNGQQELGSLAYLLTMEFVRKNAGVIQDVGREYFERLERLAAKYPESILKIEGLRHLASIHFRTSREAVLFARNLNERCIDVSVQTYKADCPPAALTKLPLIATAEVVDFIITAMDAELRKL